MDMVASSNRVINAFPPLNNITPFTRVDGWSFLEVLEGLRNYIVNTLVPEIDGDFEKITDQLNEWFAEYTKDFADLKSEWQNLFDQFMIDITNQLAIMNDNAIAILVRNGESETREALEENFIPKNKIIFNVRDYGATLDGVTPDTQAIKDTLAAVDAIGGGFVVAYPPGKWLLDSQVDLPDNVHVVGYGSELHRTASGYVSFTSTSKGAKGYGSGARNFSFSGFDVYGNFAENRSQNFVLHHAQHGKFKDMNFYQAVVSGHCVDMLGCDDIEFENCSAYGRKDTANRLYIEAFQYDCSTRSGAGGELIEDSASWDGLPCRNIRFKNVRSYPITVNDTYYNAPRLLGSHSRVANYRHTNIDVDGFYIEDSGYTNDDSNYRGWIHTTMTRGMRIRNGVAVLKRDANQMIIGLGAVSTTYPASQVHLSNPTLGSQNGAQANEDVTIENITIYGVNGIDTSNLINVAGYPNGRGAGVTINNVKAYDFHPGTDSTAGATIVNLLQQTGVTVTNIFSNRCNRLVMAQSCDGVTTDKLVGNDVYYSGTFFENCNDLTVGSMRGNMVNSHRLTNCKRVTIDPCVIKYTNHPWSYRSGHTINGCTDVIMQSPYGVSEGSLLDYHIYIYGASTNVRVVTPTSVSFTEANRLDETDSTGEFTLPVLW